MNDEMIQRLVREQVDARIHQLISEAINEGEGLLYDAVRDIIMNNIQVELSTYNYNPYDSSSQSLNVSLKFGNAEFTNDCDTIS